jgi:small membrane protein
MNIVLIQVLLIVVVVAVAARLFRSRGARSQAVRRLGLLLFAAFAVVSILFPNLWNRMAAVAGVRRGTDLVLYALVVAFLSFTVTTYLRFRDFEARYTRLARRLALDEVRADSRPTTGSTPSPAAAAGVDQGGDAPPSTEQNRPDLP